jgi:hypothetical protein
LHTDTLERFAALVRDAERNKLAAWMMAQGYATGHGDTIEGLLEELRWQVRENEREQCALVCINIANKPSNVILGVAIDCAAAIRARVDKL